MNGEYMRLDTEGGIASVTLTRPDRANTINLEMATELHEVAKRCRDDSGVRVVLLRSEGKIFSAGGDLGSFAAAGDDLGNALRALLVQFHGALAVFAYMDAPLIAAVTGTAAGAGMSMVAAANLAYASADAKFTMAYTGAGLTPDGGSTYSLPRTIGWKRSEELMLTNRTLSAQDAADWGLINAVYDDAEALEAAVAETAAKLAAGPTRAYGKTAALLRDSVGASLKDQLHREAESIAAMAESEDGREGVAAFLNKRRPEFKGR